MPIKFAVKIVGQKVYMTTANPMALTFIQDHKCDSNLTTLNLQYLGYYLIYYIQTGRLISMNLTLMQGHSGSQRRKSRIISTTKQVTRIKLATTVGHFVRDLDFSNVIWLDHLVCIGDVCIALG